MVSFMAQCLTLLSTYFSYCGIDTFSSGGKARMCDHQCKLLNKIQCWKMDSVLEKNALELHVCLAPGGQAYHGAFTCFSLIGFISSPTTQIKLL